MTKFHHEMITGHLYRLILPGKVFAYLAVGNQSAALIDTGFGAGSLRSYIRTITDLPVVVILTHGHLDHVGGAGEFAEVYIHPFDLPLMIDSMDVKLRREDLLSEGDVCTEEEMIPPLETEKIRTYESDQIFDLGGYHIRMAQLAGHTAGSHCPIFCEDRIVLFGDACNSAVFMQLKESLPIGIYKEELIRFRDAYSELYDLPLYSHPHNFGAKVILEEMISLCEAMAQHDFQGIPAWDDVCFAKPVDAAQRPADGSCANIVYRP